jgi:hypothetical protein
MPTKFEPKIKYFRPKIMCLWASNMKKTVLRIREVYPGSNFFPSQIPDPNCLHPGSRIRLKKMVSKL